MRPLADEGAPGAGGLHVITLTSGFLPMPLRVPFVHELEGFTVFRSRTVEEGRDRYDLHVGYFASATAAREALRVVRKYYAMAEIRPAPASGLGSLDDTLDTDFDVIRSAAARVVKTRATAPPRPQRYAVRLGRWQLPGGAQRIPRLPLFSLFAVYSVKAHHDEHSFQEIRLGFFDGVQQAARIADAIRGHYPQAAVVPVSDREQARVRSMADVRMAVEPVAPQVRAIERRLARPARG